MKTMTNHEIKLEIIRKLLLIETTGELKRIKEQCIQKKPRPLLSRQEMTPQRPVWA